MTAPVTIARPYAKAVFEYALAQKQLQSSALLLHYLSFAMQIPEVRSFVMHPNVATNMKVDLLASVAPDEKQTKNAFPLTNFLNTLALHKRLDVLPEIYQLFEEMRAEYEKIQTVRVVSFSPLSAKQEEKLRQSLCNRLKREVQIEIELDPALIGGAVIYAGNLVINGSVREKLLKLNTDLVA